MCKECLQLINDYLPQYSDQEKRDILLEYTAFPFAEPPRIREQLIEFNISTFIGKPRCGFCNKIKPKQSFKYLSGGMSQCYKCYMSWYLS